MKLLAIVPAYNEAENLPLVLDELRNCPVSLDILVVNDCSSDDTASVARKEGVSVLSLCRNIGIGGAIQAGFKYARHHGYDAVVQVDADGQHDPSQIPIILDPILENRADMVIGTRFRGLDGEYVPSLVRKTGMRLFAGITSFIVGQRITDTTSGFRAINRDLLSFVADNYPFDFPDSEAIIAVVKSGYRVLEMPVTMKIRHTGKSTINFGKSVYYPFRMLISILSIIIRSIKPAAAGGTGRSPRT